MAGADFLNIPSDIRQTYLPFTVNGSGKLQVFSFRPSGIVRAPAVAQIHPFPKTFERLFNADSGIQYTHGPRKKKVEYTEFLDEIPSVQIREFVPDARLTQTFKWFSYFKRGMDAAAQNTDFNLFSGGSIKDKLKDAMENMSDKMRQLTSGSAPLLAEIAAGMQSYYVDKGFEFGSDAGYGVLWIPFLLYYRLTTTKTNNIYEFPYNMQNPIMKSDGTYGWNSNNGFGLLDILGEGSGLGTLLGMGFGSTLRVNLMPHFDPSQGTVNSVNIQITIDLINDSDEAAVNNFLLCHTLFGNNKWLQYGFVQASASLYDIKLPGANRYFMCSGQFNCTGKGAFRSPSEKVVQMIYEHANKTPEKNFENMLAKAVGQNNVQNVKDQMALSEAKREANLAEANASSSTSDGNETSKGQKYNSRIFEAQEKAAREANITISESKSNEPMTSGTNSYVIKTQIPDIFTNESADDKKTFLDRGKDIRKLDKTISENEFKISDARRNLDILTKEYSAKADRKREAAKEKRDEAEQLNREAVDLHAQADKAMSDGNKEYENQLRQEAGEKTAEAGRKFDEASILETEAMGLEQKIKDESAKTEESISDLEKRNAELIKERSNLKDINDRILKERADELSGEIDARVKKQVSSSEEIKDLIKIPDVYHLELNFTSLIPDNFNTYLYGFREANLDMFKDYALGTVDETGVFEQLADKLADVMQP